MTIRSVSCLAMAAALLASCGSDAPPAETETETERSVQGDVLGGTISDDMIPLDRLQSQSPPLREASQAGTSGSGPSADAAPAAEAEEETDSAPDPDPQPEADAVED